MLSKDNFNLLTEYYMLTNKKLTWVVYIRSFSVQLTYGTVKLYSATANFNDTTKSRSENIFKIRITELLLIRSH